MPGQNQRRALFKELGHLELALIAAVFAFSIFVWSDEGIDIPQMEIPPISTPGPQPQPPPPPPPGCNNNGQCESNETTGSCPNDCHCGVNGCQPSLGENCSNCGDCGCGAHQTCSNGSCVVNCDDSCGDGVCNCNESSSPNLPRFCPQDCGCGRQR